ncbi:MAG: hypothetical protein FWG74_01535 [Planctomycetes bacterium]|nr:hypothetical protein [Planctomycetota bacterium]
MARIYKRPDRSEYYIDMTDVRGIRRRLAGYPSKPLTTELARAITQDRVVRVINGGRAIRMDREGHVVCSERRFHGGGKLIMYIDSINFSGEALGAGFMRTPSDDEVERIRSVQWLMEELER